MSSPPAPVIGFDLDMTLIDTVPGFAATLHELGRERGLEFPVERMVAHLGPPLDHLLAAHLSAEEIPAAIDRFRELYVDHAVPVIEALPGAHRAFEAVRAHGGRVLVITGKYAPNARLHLDRIGLHPDVLVGEVWGTGKAVPLREHGARVYVGDHVHDVEGALAAGVHSVSVLTGGMGEQALRAAGTHTVLEDLSGFDDWLAAHLADRTG